jgi:hypothetical protein
MNARTGWLLAALLAALVALGLQRLAGTEAPGAVELVALSGAGTASGDGARQVVTTQAQVAAAPTDRKIASAPALAPEPARAANPRNPVGANAEQQRAARDRLDQMLGCQATRALPADADRLSDWASSLPDEAVANAGPAYEDALAWARQSCESTHAPLPEAWNDDSALLLGAGFRPDDPLAQLQRVSIVADDSKVDLVQLRAALYQVLADAVAAPDVTQFLAIAGAGSAGRTDRQLGPFLNQSREIPASVWTLAACDLGADCGPQSTAMRMLCLSEMLCGYPSMEAAMIDAYWPQGSIETLSRMRHDLVARLRENGGVGIFEPPAPDGG